MSRLPTNSTKIDISSLFKGKAKAELDFMYSGGFPRLKQSFVSSDPISESQDLFKDMISSASFARGGMLYNSPLSDEAMMFTGACSRLLRFPSPPQLSTTYINIPNSSPPPIQIEELINRVDEGEFQIVFLEPLQGLGGIYRFQQKDLIDLRSACNNSKTLLVMDYVQCGLGRSGSLWAHTTLGVELDAMLIGFGDDIGIGAIVVNDLLADYIHFYQPDKQFMPTPRCLDASKLLNMVSQQEYLNKVERSGNYLMGPLTNNLGMHHQVVGIRSVGLVATIQLKVNAHSLIIACQQLGLQLDFGGIPNSIQMMPPAEVTD
ncbi:acetylornithine aminotransferase, chloroplastic/mitochondrial-like [Lactuca sativa]|uniref:acetylornithine aminotransferase, chloroplastic/mitochondrial-like n=1 Tax=Lactuca sativa TaxID=4236 RepID=UPI0022B00B43|nr:acetylornithine aminotransferase, chloroplastic/mitochondrial-like [Lactuca sativa]